MKEENQAIIKALNMYGRVPEQWELLNEIERLNNTIKKYEKMSFVHEIDLQNRIDKAIEYLTKCNNSDLKFTSRTYDILFNILKGSYKSE